MFEDLDVLVEAKRKYETAAKAIIKEVLQKFMVEVPAVKAIAWNQFTPYFNDGDTCTFHMGDVYATHEEIDSEDGVNLYDEPWAELGDYYINKYGQIGSFSTEDSHKLMDLANRLGDLQDELQDIFGDHMTVLVTKKGVETFEYEHD